MTLQATTKTALAAPADRSGQSGADRKDLRAVEARQRVAYLRAVAAHPDQADTLLDEWMDTTRALRRAEAATPSVSYGVAAAMLDTSRSAVQHLVNIGVLDRHPDGGISTASVFARARQ